MICRTRVLKRGGENHWNLCAYYSSTLGESPGLGTDDLEIGCQRCCSVAVGEKQLGQRQLGWFY